MAAGCVWAWRARIGRLFTPAFFSMSPNGGAKRLQRLTTMFLAVAHKALQRGAVRSAITCGFERRQAQPPGSLGRSS